MKNLTVLILFVLFTAYSAAGQTAKLDTLVIKSGRTLIGNVTDFKAKMMSFRKTDGRVEVVHIKNIVSLNGVPAGSIAFTSSALLPDQYTTPSSAKVNKGGALLTTGGIFVMTSGALALIAYGSANSNSSSANLSAVGGLSLVSTGFLFVGGAFLVSGGLSIAKSTKNYNASRSKVAFNGSGILINLR
jgi:hypothetical protein